MSTHPRIFNSQRTFTHISEEKNSDNDKMPEAQEWSAKLVGKNLEKEKEVCSPHSPLHPDLIPSVPALTFRAWVRDDKGYGCQW
jgi:hypothetical protein